MTTTQRFRQVRRQASITCVMLATGVGAIQAEQRWQGRISDSNCGEFHQVDRTHSKHLSDRDCTLERVREGARYILVTGGRVYQIENQDFPGLQRYAGREVKAQGNEVTSGTITITSLNRP